MASRILKRNQITRRRYTTEGHYSEGEFVKGPYEEKVFKCSVQNYEIKGSAVNNTENIGDWQEDWKEVFIELGALRPEDDKSVLQADEFVTSNGKLYQVKRVNDWDNGGLSLDHTDAFAVRIE